MSEAIEDLNEALRDVESALYSRHFGVSAEVELDTDLRLHWLKWGNEWGLYVKNIESSDAAARTPLLKTSKRIRTLAAAALPELYAALSRAKDESDAAIRKAVEMVKQLTERILEEKTETPNESEDKKK